MHTFLIKVINHLHVHIVKFNANFLGLYIIFE